MAKVTLVPCSVNLTGKRDIGGHRGATIKIPVSVRSFKVLPMSFHSFNVFSVKDPRPLGPKEIDGSLRLLAKLIHY